ncbi:MAG: hypothetical protein JSS84_07405 [Bacteroidetes bacterium]|nr:hypothetical protein [Bacteroidota bacterium]
MAARHFHSMRSYRVYVLMVLLVGLDAFIGLVITDYTGSVVWMVAAGAVGALGLAALAVVWRREEIAYVLAADHLVLRRGRQEEVIPLHKVMDANLVDLATARSHVHKQPEDEGAVAVPKRAEVQVSTRFCAVPLKGWASILNGSHGLSMESFKRTLVLVRTNDGRALLLSPRQSARMVSAIGKLLHKPAATGLRA